MPDVRRQYEREQSGCQTIRERSMSLKFKFKNISVA
jgi:hypothetical protein